MKKFRASLSTRGAFHKSSAGKGRRAGFPSAHGLSGEFERETNGELIVRRLRRLATGAEATSRPDERAGHQRAARAIATIERRVAAIGKSHQLAGLTDATKDRRVPDALTGARRGLRSAPTHAKDTLRPDDLDLTSVP